MHPEVEWHSSGAFPGLEPVYYGTDDVERWWRTVKEPFESWTIDIEEHAEVGGKLATRVRFNAVGRESGVTVDLPFGQVWEIEGGVLLRFAAYPSWEEALAAASA
jgi:hypothetical protein